MICYFPKTLVTKKEMKLVDKFFFENRHKLMAFSPAESLAWVVISDYVGPTPKIEKTKHSHIKSHINKKSHNPYLELSNILKKEYYTSDKIYDDRIFSFQLQAIGYFLWQHEKEKEKYQNIYQIAIRCRPHIHAQSIHHKDIITAFGFSVPSPEALTLIKNYSPIIEIGAGGGYWAHMLEKSGTDIVAFDNEAYEEHSPNKFWKKIPNGNENMVSKYPERTLFLGWPSNNNKGLEICLESYMGEKLILAGFLKICGTKRFHHILNANFKLEKKINLPHYSREDDVLAVYTRRKIVPKFSFLRFIFSKFKSRHHGK